MGGEVEGGLRGRRGSDARAAGREAHGAGATRAGLQNHVCVCLCLCVRVCVRMCEHAPVLGDRRPRARRDGAQVLEAQVLQLGRLKVADDVDLRLTGV